MRTLLAAVILVLLLAAVACDGGPSRSTPAVEPAQLWQRAETAMAGLQSYHVVMSFPGERDDARWEADVEARDNDYRFVIYDSQVDAGAGCSGSLEPDVSEPPATRCRETSAGGVTLREAIYAGARAFSRTCDRDGNDCSAWTEMDRPALALAGPSPTYAPQWPLVALELAGVYEAAGEGEIGGERTVHLRGRVNHLRAIFENERRLATAAGVTSFGEECTSEAGLPETPAREECRELTFEESLEQQEPDLSFYDRRPAEIDIWVSPEDSLVRRITIAAEPPPDEPDAGEVAIAIDYADFNGIEVEAPQP